MENSQYQNESAREDDVSLTIVEERRKSELLAQLQQQIFMRAGYETLLSDTKELKMSYVALQEKHFQLIDTNTELSKLNAELTKNVILLTGRIPMIPETPQNIMPTTNMNVTHVAPVIDIPKNDDPMENVSLELAEESIIETEPASEKTIIVSPKPKKKQQPRTKANSSKLMIDDVKVKCKLIETPQQLDELEISLKSRKMMTKTIKEMLNVAQASNIRDGRAACYAIINHFFDRKVLNNYSWKGQSRSSNENAKFSSFVNIIKAFETVGKTIDSEFTELKCTNFFKSVLSRKIGSAADPNKSVKNVKKVTFS